MPSKAKKKFSAKAGRLNDTQIEVALTGKIKGHPDDIEAVLNNWKYNAEDYGVDFEISGEEV